ncbi:hypothetical protein CPT_Mater152 [Bacillus phage Mater]|uniref:Uncharacterized protein n=1 Tax=Bacillus phage Mater TaxID=1540090 RepID=A0A0A0RNU2_9CAUD|nr:hypothetical protein CPT_Mater152 [Bacillus phage Mater]AIW03309.1 hypothetical protein CPT_Mater152 [Bacillus phage Mater]
MAQPISYQYMRGKAGVVKIPVYAISDFPTNSYVRLKLPNGTIGCYKLKVPDASTPLRVMTKTGIMGVDLSVTPSTSNVYIKMDTLVKRGSGTTILEDTTDYVKVNSKLNGDGATWTLNAMQPGTSYNFTGRVEVVQTVDDIISIRVYNKTQAKYINSNIARSTVTTGTVQTLTGSFNTGTNMVAGDVLELWIVQQWNNSTADDFIYKVYKTDLAIN